MGIIRTVKIKNIVIGGGRPKIIVPIVSATREAVLEDAKRLVCAGIDMVEWRADFYEDVADIKAVLDTLEKLREALCNMPILFTFRTQNEGGKKFIRTEDYVRLNNSAARSGFADIIDIEVFMGGDIAAENIGNVHGAGKIVIGSYHDFLKTPCESEIISCFRKIQDMDADICKIAVMPESAKDVLTLLSAANEMYINYADRPLIAVAMSEIGIMSRIYGGLFGSSATFGNIGGQSAPGQIQAEELIRALSIVYRKQQGTVNQ